MKFTKNCLICGKLNELNTIYTKKNGRLTCSIRCRNIFILKKTAKLPLRNKKISISKMADKNPNWAGDKIKYNGLHDWVKRRKPKPKLCENCKKTKPHDLANKEIYNRELKNWEWLCRRCHMIKDGRLEKFKLIAGRGKS